MDEALKEKLTVWAERYNNPRYFTEDPIVFPKRFAHHLNAAQAELGFEGSGWRPRLQDVEIAALFSAHLAWGRRVTIVNDCCKLFDEMVWRPYDYVMTGVWRNDDRSLHRTIKWSEIARICKNLRDFYRRNDSLEVMTPEQIRVNIFGQKEDPKAANKKLHLMRRWMVRDDGKVDLGMWKHSSKKDLVIPLDVHVYDMASSLGLTDRKSKDILTARQITDAFRELFPDDPCLGDFALFGYGVSNQ